MGKAQKTLKGIGTLFVLLVAVTCYQSCGGSQNTDFSSGSSETTIQGRANGEGYPGKLVRYEYHSETKKCPSNGSSQFVPPTDVIFATIDNKAQLVRKDCQDIAPVDLDPSLASFEMSELIYEGKTFPNSTKKTMAQLQLPCPAGFSVASGITPQNSVTAPLDFLNPSWFVQTGVNINLVGSASGFPLFNVQRLNSVPQWSRFLEVVGVQAGQTYAATAIVEAGSTQNLRVLFTEWGTQIFELDVDISDGSSTILNQDNATNIEVVATPFNKGYFVTIFFTPTINANLDVGMGPAPSGTNVDINLTGIQLISNINQYCQ